MAEGQALPEDLDLWEDQALELMDLYREELLEYYKNPPNRGVLDGATHRVHEANPLCGDVVDVYLVIKNGIIEDAKFEGQGCAISLASTSMFLEKIKGAKVEEAKKITRNDIIKEVNPNLTLSRIKCATLGYNAVVKVLGEV